MTKTERLLCELIALPSVNPAFLPAGDSHTGEQRVADFLATVAAQAGLDVEFQRVLPGRPNLIARLSPPAQIRRRILLAPHLDTVGVADKAQFAPRRRGGRLFGRGACDTKGSVAVMLTALGELARSKKRPRETEIIFAGLADEENAQAGSRALITGGLKADLAIVGEPTRVQVVTAHKGSLWLKLEASGRSAHGARPELGRNAIHTMARIVDTLETDYAASLRKRRHPLLGRATVSVGMIHGGTQPNMVPDRCAITIDRRTLPGETETGVRREIAAFLGRRNLRSPAGTACNLLEQLIRALGGTEVRQVHRGVRIDDADERNLRVVETLGDHLRAEQHRAIEGLELSKCPVVPALARCRVSVHADDRKIRPARFQLVFHALVPAPKRPQVRARALRTRDWRRLGMPAVMAVRDGHRARDR